MHEHILSEFKIKPVRTYFKIEKLKKKILCIYL